MRLLGSFVLALLLSPLAALNSYRARRRLRTYAGSERGALTLQRVA
jgi:hypothetical protein